MMTNAQYQLTRIEDDPNSLIARLQKTILVYARREGRTAEEAMGDALVDIRHLCDLWGLNFGALDDGAHDSYLKEL